MVTPAPSTLVATTKITTSSSVSGMVVLCRSSAREASAPTPAQMQASATNPATKNGRYHSTGSASSGSRPSYDVKESPTRAAATSSSI